MRIFLFAPHIINMAYTDMTYMPGGAGAMKRTHRRKRRATKHMQEGGLSFKDVANGIKNAVDWVKKNKPITAIDNFLEKSVPAQYKSNPIFNAVKQGTHLGAQLGIGEAAMKNKPRRRGRTARKAK